MADSIVTDTTPQLDDSVSNVVDAKAYDDLVTNAYQDIQSRFPSGGKHIPFGLFQYYCHTFWWYRALWLQRRNGRALDPDQRDFLDIMEAGAEYLLPSHIAQHLTNMGNFSQGGQNHLFRLPNTLNLGNANSTTVPRGWFRSNSANNVADATLWHLYNQMPSPGAYVSYLLNEAYSTTPNPIPANYLSLAAVAPTTVVGAVNAYPTDNIIGWKNGTWAAIHNSWRSTYANLGWSITTQAPDVQTQYMVSTSTLRWVSGRFSTIMGYKTLSSKQLSLSAQGNPIPAY